MSIDTVDKELILNLTAAVRELKKELTHKSAISQLGSAIRFRNYQASLNDRGIDISAEWGDDESKPRGGVSNPIHVIIKSSDGASHEEFAQYKDGSDSPGYDKAIDILFILMHQQYTHIEIKAFNTYLATNVTFGLRSPEDNLQNVIKTGDVK